MRLKRPNQVRLGFILGAVFVTGGLGFFIARRSFPSPPPDFDEIKVAFAEAELVEIAITGFGRVRDSEFAIRDRNEINRLASLFVLQTKFDQIQYFQEEYGSKFIGTTKPEDKLPQPVSGLPLHTNSFIAMRLSCKGHDAVSFLIVGGGSVFFKGYSLHLKPGFTETVLDYAENHSDLDIREPDRNPSEDSP